MPSHKLRNLLLLLALGFCWGPSFLFIRLAIEEVPPFTLVAMRLWPGALILLLIAIFQGEKPWVHSKDWRHFLAMGLFASALPFSCISAGEQYISSSLAAIVNSTTPIFTAIGAHFLVGERLTWSKIFGIICGILGILTVFLPSLIGSSQNNEQGILLVLLASMSYAVGFLYSRKFLSHLPSMVCAVGQVLAAALIITPFSMFIEKGYELSLPSFTALFGIAGLAVFGTALAFTIYYTLSKTAGATYASTSTLLFPAIAVLLGIIVLGETLSWNVMVGCPLIFLGLAIANGIIRKTPKPFAPKQVNSQSFS